MTKSRLFAALMSFTLLLAARVNDPVCTAAVVNFLVNNGNFNAGASWSDGNVPTADFDSHFVQDNLTALFTSGDTSVFILVIGDTSFGRLRMTGGSLEVMATDRFEVGRSVGGEGELILTGAATLTASGAIIGTRSKGLLSIGPEALVDLSEGGGPRDMRIGSYGPGYDDFGMEPGLNGDGFVDVHGTLNAATLIISQSGAKGEFRLSGGTANLTGGLWMHLCEGCDAPALRSAKVSIVGSGGTFTIGGDDIRASTPTATFSFTADAGGVTPLVANSAAEIDSANLELNLDAFPFTPTSTLKLIDAIPTLLVGEFGVVTFLGNTTADVNYDLINGDVFLDNFHVAAIAADFDQDGDVDGGDLLIWQRGVGRVGTGTVGNGDANGDLNVNAADLAIWKQNFGSPSVAAGGAAPEPVSFFLALMGCGILGRMRRRQSSSQENLALRSFAPQAHAAS